MVRIFFHRLVLLIYRALPLAASVALTGTPAIGTASPDQAAVERDLATIYKTEAPSPEVAFSGRPLDKRVQALLIRQAGYLTSLLKPVDVTTGALSITKSASDEHSIRPNARTVNGLAMMVRSMGQGDFPTTLSRDMCRNDAIGMLRFLLYTHGAGGLKCTNGKQWKGQWQSALWANSAGMGSWLLWNELDPEMRWLAARMICDEADRFVNQKPPSQIENDTKAEENAWDSTIVTLAACMFPQHPKHELYAETAKRWAVSSFVRKADLVSSRTVDGKTLAQWDVGPTLHDDFTMENHNRVHPDYMNTININLEQWIPYSFAGTTMPESLKFNTREVFGTLQALTFPDAGYIYVNGQDWQLHRNCHWLPTYMLQAIFYNDPGASFLAGRALETAESMVARTPNGGVFLPEEFSFPSTQADTVEMYAMVHLLLSKFENPPEAMNEETYWNSLAGLHVYESGSFAVMRTDNSFASFSWGDQPMGMVMPLDKDLLWAPNERSLIGSISVGGLKKEQPKITRVHTEKLGSGIAVTGELSRAEGAMNQKFAFVAMADGRVVYVDNLRILKVVQEPQINLGTVSVLNDPHWVYHDGTRDLYSTGGKKTFDVKDGRPASVVEMSSPWYNVDDKLGIVVASSDGRQIYDDVKTFSNGRLEQMLSLNALLPDAGQADPSQEPLTHTALVFFPKQPHGKTAEEASHVKAEWTGSDDCVLKLDDGKVLKIDLATGVVEMK